MTGLLDFSDIGASFLFGSLVNDRTMDATTAFKVLPTVIFVSSLMAGLLASSMTASIAGLLL